MVVCKDRAVWDWDGRDLHLRLRVEVADCRVAAEGKSRNRVFYMEGGRKELEGDRWGSSRPVGPWSCSYWNRSPLQGSRIEPALNSRPRSLLRAFLRRRLHSRSRREVETRSVCRVLNFQRFEERWYSFRQGHVLPENIVFLQ